ncbi:MAG: hypothetical protein KGD64_14970, partial [Candidatus Heimdallarchaeota archaeon]|nr:hypothetical protein [Candidatus Heimdallarchaeota archaeon]
MGRKSMCKIYSSLILLLFSSSLLVPLFIDYSPNNTRNNYFMGYLDEDFSNNIDTDYWDFQDDTNLKLAYTPIDGLSGSSINFDITDQLTFNHPFEINLTKADYSSIVSENSFSLADIPGYTPDLAYNITSIVPLPDYIEIESAKSGNEDLGDGDYLALAQGFEIQWDYAQFVGADMWLEVIGSGSLGTDSLDLFLIKDENVFPDINNVSKILSYDRSNPYDNGHLPPSVAANALTFYDFEDVILEKGKYILIANLSSVDLTSPGMNFAWTSKNGVPYLGKTYRFDSNTLTWENRTNVIDFSLMPKVLQLDASQQPLIYTDPDEISLVDNNVAVHDTNQILSGTGSHLLNATISVNIKFNNSYTFARTYSGTSNFATTNTSFAELATSWDISWNIDQIDFTSYTNPQRTHKIITPDDWDGSSVELSINSSIPLVGQKTTNGFFCELNTIIVSSSYSGGTLQFTTLSPNYLYDYILTDGSSETTIFNLGYWTHNTTHATGYEGSTVSADILIKDSTLADITTGELNFTIYNSTGEIIPFKTSIYANLSYTDTSNYTILTTSQTSPGIFDVNTALDPSVYRTDVEGFWTLMYFWNNGSEIGFYSHKISVNKPTLAEFFVEDEVGGTYVEISSTEITRINGDEINVKISYYNISDPFFSGLGTYIPAGDVHYSTSWLDSDNLVYDAGNYSYSVAPNITEGNYNIDLYAEGPFLQNHTSQFSLVLLHQFSVRAVQWEDSVHYTENTELEFALEDLTYGNELLTPDDITISINGTLLVETTEYSFSMVTNHITIIIFNEILEYYPGVYQLEITAIKA